MANPNNWKQHSEVKPEFTDYTIAGGKEGEVRAAISRLAYQQERDYIRTGRSLRRMCRKTEAFRRSQHQARGGYPTKRERNEDIPSHRGVPHSNFLKQFKIVGKLSYALGEAVYTAKVYVLHATRGWKLYA